LAMTGYPESATGYGANMQPALAVAVDAGIPMAAEAWAKYQTRNPKQDYGASPQFAVVPGGPATGMAVRNTESGISRKRTTSLEYLTRPAGTAVRWESGGRPGFYDVRGGLRLKNPAGKE
jgi:hypothetical protein